MDDLRGEGLFGALSGRAVAIAIVAVVSGASFSLGYFVGRAVESPSPAAARSEAPPSAFHEPAAEVPENAAEEAPGDLRTYTVQAGSFLDSAHAEAFKKNLAARGYGAYVLRSADGDDRTVYKVRVGTFKERADAELLALKLKKISGQNAFVTTE
jgi:cell division protein FtsN